jgi:hypothetical protein
METVSAREVVGNLGVDVVLGLLGAGPVTWNVRLGRTELGSMSVVTVICRVIVLVVVLYSSSSSGVSLYGRSRFAFAPGRSGRASGCVGIVIMVMDLGPAFVMVGMAMKSTVGADVDVIDKDGAVDGSVADVAERWVRAFVQPTGTANDFTDEVGVGLTKLYVLTGQTKSECIAAPSFDCMFKLERRGSGSWMGVSGITLRKGSAHDNALENGSDQ